MKLSDIKIGQAYATKRYRAQAHSFEGVVVAVDIGNFETTTSSDAPRKVHWRTRVIDVGRSWYITSSEKRRRVVVVDLHHQQIQVLSAASLHAQLDQETVRDLCLRYGLHETRMDMEKRLSEQFCVFTEQFGNMLAEITNTDNELKWDEKQNPHRVLLRKPQFVETMVRLWLNYCDARGMHVNGRAACDVLADFEDVATGLAQAQARKLRLNAEAEKQAVLVHAQHFESPLRIEAA
jgi:hypothetical protein